MMGILTKLFTTLAFIGLYILILNAIVFVTANYPEILTTETNSSTSVARIGFGDTVSTIVNRAGLRGVLDDFFAFLRLPTQIKGRNLFWIHIIFFSLMTFRVGHVILTTERRNY